MCNHNMANKKKKEEKGIWHAKNKECTLLRKYNQRKKKIDHEWFMLQRNF